MNLRQLSTACLVYACVFSTGIARADVAPPNKCATEGQPCNTAPPDYQSPGVCTPSKCQQATQDGSVEYPCTLCLPSASAGTGGSTGTGGSNSTKSSDGEGCFVRAPAGTRGGFVVALGLALAGLAALRRRA